VKTPHSGDRRRIVRLLEATPTPGIRPGLHQLVDVRERCTVEPGDELACWIWPSRSETWFPATRTIMGAARAAWLLAGLPVASGERVFRLTCQNTACVHPLHGAAGSIAESNAVRAASGLYRPTGDRLVQLAAARHRMMATPATVARAEQLLQSGLTQRAVAAQVGLHEQTVGTIAHGVHPFSLGRAPAARGASIFAGALA
jgi:hypothetical protein